MCGLARLVALGAAGLLACSGELQVRGVSAADATQPQSDANGLPPDAGHDRDAANAPHGADAARTEDSTLPPEGPADVGLRGHDRPLPPGAPADAATDARPPVASPDAAPPPAEPPPEAPCVDAPYVRPDACPYPVEVVIWTVGGWNLLADAFAANPAPCAEYFISVPPFAGDKTTLRDGEAARIRAHGPQFHAMAEFSDGAWGEWRAANDTTWIAAGQEFRRRATAAGYCLGQGDGWMVNEVHSSIRSDPATRDRWVNLFRSLHEGEAGAADDATGAVAVVGMAQSTVNLGVYKANLANWLADAAFWEGVAPHVRWWAQESYCDTGRVCVAGDLDARAQHINRYAMHVGRLSVVAPDGAGVNPAQSYFSRAFVPMLNAVWGSTPANGYGDTDVSLEQMQMFVTEQIYANRRYAEGNAHPDGRISFALQSYRSPREYAALGARMAEAIANAYAPGAEPLDACRGNGGAQGFCRCAVDGAAFNDAWDTFQAW